MRSLVRLVLIVALVLPRFAAAQAVTLGSQLQEGPNVSFDCNTQPVLDPNNIGSWLFLQSGQADCTWRQSGVFGNQNDTRFSSVPGDGRIVAVTIRSGPAPVAPLRVVIMRTLSTGGFGAEQQCCFFVSESAPLALTANATQTFAVNIPVVRNTINGFQAVDLVGFSAASGTGALPLRQVGPIESFNLTNPGSVNAGFFYPRVGATPDDSGGGRREEGIPGIELTTNFTFCPAANGDTGPGSCVAGGGGGGGGGGGTGPALRSQNAGLRGGSALVDMVCNGDAICKGLIELLTAGSASPAWVTARELPIVAAAAGGARYGKKKFKLKAGANAILKVPLSKKAKKALKQAGTLPVTVRITPKGAASFVTTLTITK